MAPTLARTEPSAPVVTSDQVDLIKRTVAADATADELKLYLYDCARLGVHPLDKLLHFTTRGGKYTPITSIDFMRMRAADTGECIGIDDATFAGEPKRADFAAQVSVYRLVQGQRCTFTATARWPEYCPDPGPNRRGDLMWQRMPHVMLSKCAEALALRKGFPRQLAGLYAKEEMDQAHADNIIDTVVEPPAKSEGNFPKSEGNSPKSEGNSRPTVSAPVVEKIAKHYASTHNTAPATPLPAGAVRVDRVDRNTTKKGNLFALVTLSTGEVVQTFDHALMADCDLYAAGNVAVVAVVGAEKYGYPQLQSVAAYTPPLPLDEAGQPVDWDDIAF